MSQDDRWFRVLRCLAGILLGCLAVASGQVNEVPGERVARTVSFRWQVLDTAGAGTGWLLGNDAALSGGVSPSAWASASGSAAQMSTDTGMVASLLTRKGYAAGANAMVWTMDKTVSQAEAGASPAQLAIAAFRVRNATAAPVVWDVSFHYSCQGSRGTIASAAIDGSVLWDSGSADVAAGVAAVAASIPPGTTSTVIFVASSHSAASDGIWQTLQGRLGFGDNCLALPVGLEFVDDLGPSPSPFRWRVFDTYGPLGGWQFGNSAELLGGVAAEVWSDGAATAADMSTDPGVLASLLTGKGWGGPNAVVWTENKAVSYAVGASPHAAFGVAGFRIRNTTDATLVWNASFHYSSHGSRGNRASVAVNGSLVWDSGAADGAGVLTLPLELPATGTSTVVLVSSSYSHTNDRSWESLEGQLALRGGCLALPAGLEFVDDFSPAPVPYRWQVFDVYDAASGWQMGNDSSLFGGVAPSQWGSGATAASMSQDSSVLASLLTRKAWAGANAAVWTLDRAAGLSSFQSEHAVVAFRVANTTDAPITWRPYFHYSCNGPWSDLASVAVNGTIAWASSATLKTAGGTATVSLSLPATCTSTVVFVSSSSVSTIQSPWRMQMEGRLGFYNNSLALPEGLRFVDDDLIFLPPASKPSAPILSNPARTTLDVAIQPTDGNPADTQYALQLSSLPTGTVWVQTDGSLAATAAWQSAAQWGTTTITGLAGATLHTVKAKARNGEGLETVFGPAATAETHFLVTFEAAAGGTLAGGSPQYQAVPRGGACTPVEALPAERYVFIDWQDGRTDNPRTVTSVNADMTLTARFGWGPQPDVAVPFRWQVFDTYGPATGWLLGDDPSLFGGVRPSDWSNGASTAADMSTDSAVLSALLTNAGHTVAGNAMIWTADKAVSHAQGGASHAEFAVAAFRVRNNTDAAVTWNASFHYSCHGSRGSRASVALDGVAVWDSGTADGPGSVSVPIELPAAHTGTVVFVSSSYSATTANDWQSLEGRLGFYGNCLALPAGLEFIDDPEPACAPFRWQVFDAYGPAGGWQFGDNAALLGGVAASTWSNGDATAADMSTDPAVLGSLLNRRGQAARNGLIWTQDKAVPDSTDRDNHAQVAVAAFRVRNNTDAAVTWNASFGYSCHGSRGNRASLAVNGTAAWDSGVADGTGSATVAMELPAAQTSTVIVVSSTYSHTNANGWQSLEGQLGFTDNCLDLPAGLEFADDLDPALVPYRWQVFDAYGGASGWQMGNDPALFGGVHPSRWGDSSYTAGHMTMTSAVLAALLVRKGYAGPNAAVWTETGAVAYGSTHSRHVVAAFRIHNSTDAVMTWRPYFYYSSYGGWGNIASAALNGTTVWTSSSSNTASGTATVALPIPANGTSTVVFAASTCYTGNAYGWMNLEGRFGFYNNSLTLPQGLLFVEEDLVIAPPARVPAAPLLSSPSRSTLDVAIGESDGNPAATEYALQLDSLPSGSVWVQPDGSLGATAAWRSAAQWGTTTITNLAGATLYTLRADARNADRVEAGLGPAATAETHFLVTFQAAAGGTLAGGSPQHQAVPRGADCNAVEAVPYTGYYFAEWSDGVSTNPRTVADVTGDLLVIAQFMPKAGQTIAFGLLPTMACGDPPFALEATASSGLPVSFSSSDGTVATVDGTTVTILGPGEATITASQDGDAKWDPAPAVARALVVHPVLTVVHGSGGGPHAVGTEVTVAADIRPGRTFVDWTCDPPEFDGSLTDTTASETTFVMPGGNAILTATYTLDDPEWTVDLTVAGALPETLTFGMHAAGSDGLVEGLDAAGPPLPLSPGQTALVSGDLSLSYSTQFRAPVGTAEFLLIASAADGTPVTVAWNASDLPEGKYLTIYEVVLEGLAPSRTAAARSLVGNTARNLALPSSLLVPAGETRCYVIRYGDDLVFDLAFVAGWNLISLPIEPLDPAADSVLGASVTRGGSVLRAGLRNTISSRRVWSWQEPHYVAVDELHACAGYWVHATTPAVLLVPGKPVVQTGLSLVQGWNLCGAAEVRTVPKDDTIRGPVWLWDAVVLSYGSVTKLQPGWGYWINADAGEGVTIPFAER